MPANNLAKALADSPVLRGIVAKYGPPSEWPDQADGSSTPLQTANSERSASCRRCQGTSWVNRPEPKVPPATCRIPDHDHAREYCPTMNYRAVPCPECSAEDTSERTETLWRLSGVDLFEQERCTFARFDLAANPEMAGARNAARIWSEGDGRPFLVLWSEVKGLGKTHLAIAAAGGCIARGESVAYLVWPRYLDELRETMRRPNEGDERPPSLLAARRRAESYPAVILDDVAADKGSEWADEQLLSIVNERWRRGLRTLVTTNTDPSRLEERTRSRLMDARLSLVVACRGQDYRARRFA